TIAHPARAPAAPRRVIRLPPALSAHRPNNSTAPFVRPSCLDRASLMPRAIRRETELRHETAGAESDHVLRGQPGFPFRRLAFAPRVRVALQMAAVERDPGHARWRKASGGRTDALVKADHIPK